MKRDLRSPPFQLGPPSTFVSSSNSGLQVPPFSFLILHIPRNIPNGEMMRVTFEFD